MRISKAKPVRCPVPMDVATCVRIWEQLGPRLDEHSQFDCFESNDDPIREAEEQLYLFVTKRLATAASIVSITATQE